MPHKAEELLNNKSMLFVFAKLWVICADTVVFFPVPDAGEAVIQALAFHTMSSKATSYAHMLSVR